MPRMKVECKRLYLATKNYQKGSIIEVTDDEAYELIKDGNATPAPDDAPLSEGEVTIIDHLERKVLAGEFEEAREIGASAPSGRGIRIVPGAEEVSTPQAGLAGMPRLVADRDAEPIPGTSSEG